MKSACSHHSDTLMLDVLGEPMDSQLRRGWDSHLASCEGCRREREQLARVLGRVRRAGEPPALSARQADAMARHVGWRVRNERLTTRGAAPRRRVAVWRSLAAACALLVVVAVVYRAQERLFPEPLADLQDIEVIKNLDLLREMDTIEKLVEVVDLDLSPAGSEPGQAPGAETQGSRDSNGKSYV